MSDSSSETYQVVELEAQQVAGVSKALTMATLDEASDEIPHLMTWLTEHGHEPSGAPFVRYLVIDMAAVMQVQAGIPVAQPVEGDGRVEADVLPAGQYLTTTHFGPYDGLYQATVGLLRYAGEHGLQFDKQASADGEIWASRIEWYETDPAEQPDPHQWVTRLAFKLKDQQG